MGGMCGFRGGGFIGAACAWTGQACSQRCVAQKTYQKIGVLVFNSIDFLLGNYVSRDEQRFNAGFLCLSDQTVRIVNWATPSAGNLDGIDFLQEHVHQVNFQYHHNFEREYSAS